MSPAPSGTPYRNSVGVVKILLVAYVQIMT